jgi:hypothetical protein
MSSWAELSGFPVIFKTRMAVAGSGGKESICLITDAICEWGIL